MLRADDKPETLRQRLEVYYKNTAPLLDYLRQQGKLTTLDGMAPIGAVTTEIGAILDSLGGTIGPVFGPCYPAAPAFGRLHRRAGRRLRQ